MLSASGRTYCLAQKNGSDYWRALAAETRSAAEQLHDPKAVRIMLRIAEAYDGLAERCEKQSEIEKVHSK